MSAWSGFVLASFALGWLATLEQGFQGLQKAMNAEATVIGNAFDTQRHLDIAAQRVALLAAGVRVWPRFTNEVPDDHLLRPAIGLKIVKALFGGSIHPAILTPAIAESTTTDSPAADARAA